MEQNLETLFSNAEYTKALDFLDNSETILSLKKEDYYLYKGYCLSKIDKLQDALQCIVKVLSFNRSIKYKIAIYNIIQDIYREQYIEYNTGINYINELIKVLEPYDIYLIKFYQFFFYEGYFSPEEVIGVIDKFLNLNNTNFEIYEIKAQMHAALCDYNLAIENIQKALLLNKDAKRKYLELIKIYKEQL